MFLAEAGWSRPLLISYSLNRRAVALVQKPGAGFWFGDLLTTPECSAPSRRMEVTLVQKPGTGFWVHTT